MKCWGILVVFGVLFGLCGGVFCLVFVGSVFWLLFGGFEKIATIKLAKCLIVIDLFF